ncbi:FecR family protein [Chitinophaga rhizophila]|uniref:FecR domain-containing protein n=1 Tax=Chitinophaga rhizophila TaxID=2866212 RepID=A0ABS7G7V8_9BACT|nr:FecR family protein [Chitinophaga rhizophila]MBW8683476.1 FecR domain-containing protein [Chitinophaga rhizophila]
MNFNYDYIESLIIADLLNRTTADEKDLLKQLMVEHPELEVVYRECKEALSTPDAQTARQNAAKFDAYTLVTPQIRPGRGSNFRMYLAAAVLIAVLCCVFTIFRERKQNVIVPSDRMVLVTNGTTIDLEGDTAIKLNNLSLHNHQKTLSYNPAGMKTGESGTLNVPAGKFQSIVLSDGTKVMLNSETRLDFPLIFDGPKREITIKGEAYLEIAKDATKPFVVHLPKSTVQVLGTEFNVNTYDDDEKISLISGSVQANTNGESVILKPGQQAMVSDSRKVKVAPFDVDKSVSWTKGIYAFENVTLPEVAKVISRWYGLQVEVSAKYKDVVFFGIVDRSQPVEEFLKRVQFIRKIEFIQKGNKIIIQ